ncbi:AAA family ATPase [Dyadobacter fermentans]|uniref:AAA family ATPase n=1 Tax=Dyadobacter fermentans TaxID=94254 RepID=UPI001CBEEE3B|nr:AAA family ATPase [Dyadobacter fermentans]MBZ1358758.1 AAA family ATPase [Dyadobacter fermentans]
MIKKINSIKNFGVFQDFTWPATLPEFNEKNIIYGWNYTGKTTLSRIFSSLRDKELHSKFPSGQFKITTSTNQEIRENDLNTNPLLVCVFNAEYIRDNLRWETDERVEGISFDVGENVAIRAELEENLRQIAKINGTDAIRGRKDDYKQTVANFDQFDLTKFTIEARRIKNDIFNSLIDFDKRHLITVKSQLSNDLSSHIISDTEELLRTKQASLATNNKNEIVAIHLHTKLEELHSKTKNILNSTPSSSTIIPILENDSKLYTWAKLGLPLHENANECAFCGNTLEPNRLKTLNAYFSNESAKVRDEINQTNIEIEKEIESLNRINLPGSKNDFIDNLQDSYQHQLDRLTSLLDDYQKQLTQLKSELKRKENENIFNYIELEPLDTSVITNIDKWLNDINNIVTSHNDFVKNFNKKQNSAREQLKKHQVSIFLREEQYYKLEGEKNFANRCIARYDCLIRKISNRNKVLEGQLKSIVAGQQELNSFIKKILNRDDIIIEVTHDDKFILKRGEKVAENLSEGEKTAISFAYFLVSLESLHREGKLKDTIIFIDDPISSLDGNHIAQIYSLINSFFFRQNEDPSEPQKFVNCFKQLFISTHNFEFFSFLKDSNRINKRNTREYYFIKRLSTTKSRIQELPKSLRDYKSEYIYLFDIIFNFFNDGCQEADERLILMPNAVRRFLEIYTLMKLPDSTDEVDARLKNLLPEPNQLKTLHHFSHFTTFEKVTRHDELLMNLSEAIGELMSLLAADPLHFNSLKKAINVN